MDKRKKLLKLFRDIRSFCSDHDIAANPHTFLLNRYYFTTLGKRISPSLLAGISADDFLKINRRFSDRLKHELVSSWSVSYILSLPHPAPMETAPRLSSSQHDILFLSDAVYLPRHLEKGHRLHFAYHEEGAFLSPFTEVFPYPFSKEKPVEISLQSTIFDLFSGDRSAKVKPYQFHLVLDEAITSDFPPEQFFRNIALLLHEEGSYLLHLKKNFLMSPVTKKEKKFLYDIFSLREINKDHQKLVLDLGRKRTPEPERSIAISDRATGSFFTVPNDFITFNNLLTFNDNLAYEEILLLQKIEKQAEGTCADHFDFFIGMFPAHGTQPPVEALRRTPQTKPLIRGKEIVPFTDPAPHAWVIPDKEFFFQLPAAGQFERPKLIARYLSVRPAICIDRSKLYFLSDVAGIIPRNGDLPLEYAEGFLNSDLILFYYTLKFPHHNKFLKKNFNSIPFTLAKKQLQEVVAAAVRAIRSGDGEKGARDLNRSIYQLFRLTSDEIRGIERYVERYRARSAGR